MAAHPLDRKPEMGRKRNGRRLWHVSPDEFRALRHSCFLTIRDCAEYVGVSARTVQQWDAGRCRVPLSVIRLLRLRRLGDLGAIEPTWAGWTLNRNGLWSPDGKRHDAFMMTRWWIVLEQARLWRADYDRRNPPAPLSDLSHWTPSLHAEQAQLEFHSEKPAAQVTKQEPSDHPSADTHSHEHNEHHPQSRAVTEAQLPEQTEVTGPYEARRRTQVVDLAAYRHARQAAQG